jgi:hypothetical protein
MTLPLKQQLLEDLIDRLKMNLHYINDFEQFFEWRKLKAHFSEKEERVIKALIKAAPKNWLAAFDTWYLHHLLLEQNQTDTDYQALLKTYFKHFKLLKEKSADFIQDLWVKERKNVILGAKKSRRNSLATFLKKPKNESAFRFYFNKQLERITHFFPIVLMTVDRAKELINHKNAFKFDALIVNDAANLTKKEGGHLLSLANRVQIYGTGRQGSLPLNQSFWSLAKSLSGKHIHLKNQHAKKGFPLLAFNKAAFGTDTNTFIDKTPLNQQSLQVYATNGLYDEELSINDGECRHMLSMLNQIKGTSWNTFPKVGFVCATKEQRNHFSSYLLKIKQKQSNGAEKIKQLERNGMGVFSFEEINDQQFDILIISFTFSPVNTAGEMSRDMDFLIATEGRAILQNLLNKGIDEIRICHSFPNSFIQSRIKDRDKPNLMLLANLIDYAQYLSQNNPKGLNKVLKRLQEDELKDREAASTIFLEEVAFHLKSYFEQNRIGQQVSINGEVYPLIIKGKNAKQPNYLIIADPFLQTSPIYSYSWQRQQHQNLMAMGYKIIAVWSRNWWRNPENEARKLASIIIKEDGAFSKES